MRCDRQTHKCHHQFLEKIQLSVSFCISFCSLTSERLQSVRIHVTSHTKGKDSHLFLELFRERQSSVTTIKCAIRNNEEVCGALRGFGDGEKDTPKLEKREEAERSETRSFSIQIKVFLCLFVSLTSLCTFFFLLISSLSSYVILCLCLSLSVSLSISHSLLSLSSLSLVTSVPPRVAVSSLNSLLTYSAAVVHVSAVTAISVGNSR